MKPMLALLFFFSVFLAPVTARAEEGDASGLVIKAGVECKLQRGKLICASTNDDEDDEDDEDDDEEDEEEHDDDQPARNDCSRARCEPGMVVLDKPNRYGACCEAREGLPAPTTEPEQCKFPGQIGTPPNCDCPKDTVFLGYKGCVSCASICNEACARPFRAYETCHGTKGADACSSERDAYMNCQVECINSRCPDSGLLGG